MKSKSLFQKLVICLIAGLVCGETFLRVGDRFLAFLLPTPAVVGVAAAIAIGSLIFAFIWHKRHVQNKTGGERAHTFWVGAIRYGIAFDLAMFGFQKIFHLQFNTPLGMLDEPFSSFSSQSLTWSYFGHSYGFACTIGVSQILGSMLLVFNRTRLLGVIVLIPVMLNIIFIDYFYALDLGVLLHALILFAGLIYLLMLDYQRLVTFFLKHNDEHTSTPIVSTGLKLFGRLSILFVPLLLITIHGSPNKDPDLKGKYTVTEMRINGVSKTINSCADSLLTLVYFDFANDCVFEFNSQQRRMFGSYQLDERRTNITTSWHFPPAAKAKGFSGILKRRTIDEVALIGRMEGDSIEVTLKRQ